MKFNIFCYLQTLNNKGADSIMKFTSKLILKKSLRNKNSSNDCLTTVEFSSNEIYIKQMLKKNQREILKK